MGKSIESCVWGVVQVCRILPWGWSRLYHIYIETTFCIACLFGSRAISKPP
jgi:hypothetical protein